MASSPKRCAEAARPADAVALLAWFDGRRREVPWRGERDPYAILVAEVMAQQTRLETAVPFHRRFIDRFPDLHALAKADEDEVLRLWEGLGYYARARNLRRAARRVVAEYGGRLPETVAELRRLPGVGPYTAGAVASLAFGQLEPAVDGNARRVLARLADLETPTPSRLASDARNLLTGAPGRPGAVNQALMDLGSQVCTPRRPRCGECPLSTRCLARRRGTIARRPAPRRRGRSPERLEAAAVVDREGRLLVLRRPSVGLLGGLWDFPSVALGPTTTSETALSKGLREGFGLDCQVGVQMRVLRHTFSHFRLRLAVHRASWLSGEMPTEVVHRWARPAELSRLAFPIYHRRLIDRELSSPRDRRDKPGA